MNSFKFARILPGVSSDFHCANSDIDSYFRSDRAFYEAELRVVTYALTLNNGDDLVAMVSLANDYLNLGEVATGPAVKITALGVNEAYKGRGIGVSLIQFLQAFFIIENKTGCRYMTVDSYNHPRTLNFYTKHCKFIEIQSNGSTTSMFYDLLKTKETFDENPSIRKKYLDMIRKIAETGSGVLDVEDEAPPAFKEKTAV